LDSTLVEEMGVVVICTVADLSAAADMNPAVRE